MRSRCEANASTRRVVTYGVMPVSSAGTTSVAAYQIPVTTAATMARPPWMRRWFLTICQIPTASSTTANSRRNAWTVVPPPRSWMASV